MKIKTKLILINLILWLALAGFAFWATFYLINSMDVEPYVIKSSHISAIETTFDDLQVGIETATNTNQVTSILTSYNHTVEEYNYKLICYNSSKAVVYKNGFDNVAIKRLTDYIRNNETWIFYDDTVAYTAKYGNYYVIAVNDTNRVNKSIFRAYLWYPICITLLGSFIIIVISVTEYAAIFPRLKRLKYAMHQVYCGNYSKVMVNRVKNKDEISDIIVEFEMMRKHLAELTKAKAQFDRQRGETITGITHDLKTPLTVIQGYAKGLVDGVAARMGKTNEYAQKIYEMVKSMNVLVNKLADFSKPGNDDIIYTFVERDIVEIIKDFVNNYSIQYAAKGLNIKAEYKSSKMFANIDREQFVRIVQNILDNSVKYKTKPVGNTKITLYEEDENVIIVIADDGEGVEEYETEYIFESYYRGDPSRTNPISGSGLGLSIVKSIVTAHKGEVVAYNDNGLVIKISIPQRRSRK